MADDADAIVIDHRVEVGYPPDAPMLEAAIGGITTRF